MCAGTSSNFEQLSRLYHLHPKPKHHPWSIFAASFHVSNQTTYVCQEQSIHCINLHLHITQSHFHRVELAVQVLQQTFHCLDVFLHLADRCFQFIDLHFELSQATLWNDRRTEIVVQLKVKKID